MDKKCEICKESISNYSIVVQTLKLGENLYYCKECFETGKPRRRTGGLDPKNFVMCDVEEKEDD